MIVDGRCCLVVLILLHSLAGQLDAIEMDNATQPVVSVHKDALFSSLLYRLTPFPRARRPRRRLLGAAAILGALTPRLAAPRNSYPRVPVVQQQQGRGGTSVRRAVPAQPQAQSNGGGAGRQLRASTRPLGRRSISHYILGRVNPRTGRLRAISYIYPPGRNQIQSRGAGAGAGSSTLRRRQPGQGMGGRTTRRGGGTMPPFTRTTNWNGNTEFREFTGIVTQLTSFGEWTTSSYTYYDGGPLMDGKRGYNYPIEGTFNIFDEMDLRHRVGRSFVVSTEASGPLPVIESTTLPYSTTALLTDRPMTAKPVQVAPISFVSMAVGTTSRTSISSKDVAQPTQARRTRTKVTRPK